MGKITILTLDGRGGRPHMAYNIRTNEVLLHDKFQPPSSKGVAWHRSQAEGQTKKGAFKYMFRFYTGIKIGILMKNLPKNRAESWRINMRFFLKPTSFVQ